MRILTLISALLLSFALYAQQDPAAMTVLSDFSKKAKQAPSVSIAFRLISTDSKDNSADTIPGSVVIAGDKYKLSLPDNTVWSDGKTSWSYLKDVDEVTITTPDPEEKAFTSKPSLLFSLYKEGYKVKLIEESSKSWTIDLYPETLDNNLIRIRLKIGKSTYDLKSAEYKTKDGILVTLLPDKYDLTTKPDQNFFVFDSSKYKGVEIIDMR
jgi:outer membrane lipoprotein carrier protein